jgi:hypothetical protein
VAPPLPLDFLSAFRISIFAFRTPASTTRSQTTSPPPPLQSSDTSRKPPLVDPLHDELRLLNRPVDAVLLRHVRLVRLHRLDQLPRAQERRVEQDRVLPLFFHEFTRVQIKAPPELLSNDM